LSKQQLGITWGVTGNRFYNNRGDGSFADVTDITGTRSGGWGWGACFADFNNDGWLDLFHVNGYESSLNNQSPFPFRNDPSRLFINDHQGGFRERAVELGIADNKQGRGLVCFDYDRDGDVDIFVANNEQAPLLYENRGLHQHWLQVKVGGEQQNSEAIGARVYLTVNGVTQLRELNAGSNFMSQNPVIAHFGIGKAVSVDEVRVVWPSGATRTLTGVGVDQVLLIEK
ncbi:MAG: CRTAC1 family protein, partial [Pseudomonadota bacterium]